MAVNTNVKITVVKKLFHEDMIEMFGDGPWQRCKRFELQQHFISQGANMPQGFCSWAWADIQKYVLTLARGGNFNGVKQGMFVTCCSDGFRPVVFKLERIED